MRATRRWRTGRLDSARWLLAKPSHSRTIATTGHIGIPPPGVLTSSTSEYAAILTLSTPHAIGSNASDHEAIAHGRGTPAPPGAPYVPSWRSAARAHRRLSRAARGGRAERRHAARGRAPRRR